MTNYSKISSIANLADFQADRKDFRARMDAQEQIGVWGTFDVQYDPDDNTLHLAEYAAGWRDDYRQNFLEGDNIVTIDLRSFPSFSKQDIIDTVNIAIDWLNNGREPHDIGDAMLLGWDYVYANKPFVG